METQDADYEQKALDEIRKVESVLRERFLTAENKAKAIVARARQSADKIIHEKEKELALLKISSQTGMPAGQAGDLEDISLPTPALPAVDDDVIHELADELFRLLIKHG